MCLLFQFSFVMCVFHNILVKHNIFRFRFYIWWVSFHVDVIGLGAWRPYMKRSIGGTWLVPNGPQSCRPDEYETRCVKRCAMEKPPAPSNWVNTIITCLVLYWIKYHFRLFITKKQMEWTNLWFGGIESTVLNVDRVETTLALSVQSQITWTHRSWKRFSIITTKPAQPFVK